jgi:transcriptional regulator with XRE-family HTH domain
VVATSANALGDYLRARRDQLRPDDVGLRPGARRRVPGLRREEVATLAGISSAYYLRLEQGRDIHPSGQVVAALAQALRLDRKATEYLQQLASSTGSRPPQSTVQTVTQRLRQLIDQIPFPAMQRTPPDRPGPVLQKVRERLREDCSLPEWSCSGNVKPPRIVGTRQIACATRRVQDASIAR